MICNNYSPKLARSSRPQSLKIETGRSRGFGFVEMSSKEESQKAIEQFNGQDLGGRALNVNEVKPRSGRWRSAFGEGQ